MTENYIRLLLKTEISFWLIPHYHSFKKYHCVTYDENQIMHFENVNLLFNCIEKLRLKLINYHSYHAFVSKYSSYDLLEVSKYTKYVNNFKKVEIEIDNISKKINQLYNRFNQEYEYTPRELYKIDYIRTILEFYE